METLDPGIDATFGKHSKDMLGSASLLNKSRQQSPPAVEFDNDKFKQFLDTLNRHHEQFGSTEQIIDKCLLKLKNVRTRNNWDTFLSSCGSHIAIRRRHGFAYNLLQ